MIIKESLVALVTILALQGTQPLAAGPRLIHAGPMVGHVSESRAKVWIRIKEGAKLEARAHQGNTQFSPVKYEDLDDQFFLVHFAGLTPASSTRVDLQVSRAGSETERVSVQFRSAPVPSMTGKVRIAFGSCSKVSQFGGAPIYQTIADETPDMAIFVGDNSYFIVGDGSDRHFHTTGPIGDWTTPEGMLARHLVTRTNPDLTRMLRSVPSYAVWDDHDYGPDNEDREFDLKEEALRVFRQVWANPGYGTDRVPGIFSSFRFGPVEIFLMDDRYHKYSPQRHKDVTPETGVIWGTEQTDWLLAGLKATTAPIKVIANGTQVISKSKGGEGHFQEAKREQQRLLDFLGEEGIGGVVILSGDRHYSEAMQQVRGDGVLVVECTSSPLQQNQSIGAFERNPHSNQLWALKGNNYGLVTVDIPGEGKGTVRFEIRDEKNQVPVVNGTTCVVEWKVSQLVPSRP